MLHLVATKVPVAEWHGRFHDPALGDAILDPRIDNAYRPKLQGESRCRTDPPFTDADHLR